MTLTCLLPVEQPLDSFINPVERIMSLLNLTLHRVPLGRSPMSVSLLKSCYSMAEIRELADKNPCPQSAYISSVKSAIDLVISQFNRLSLRDEPVYACVDWMKEVSRVSGDTCYCSSLLFPNQEMW